MERRFRHTARSASSTEASAYQGAMEAVFAIVIAVGLGYWADRHFATSPRWLITGAVIGFGAFVLRLMRMGELIRQDEDGHKDDNDLVETKRSASGDTAIGDTPRGEAPGDRQGQRHEP